LSPLRSARDAICSAIAVAPTKAMVGLGSVDGTSLGTGRI